MNTAITAPTPRGWIVPALAFLTILLDGFDTTSIGFVIPTLAREWNLPPSAFTPALVMTSLGAVLGYIISGAIAARHGRRTLILGSVLLFALGSYVTAYASSISMLACLRLITGIGLGAAIPVAISVAVDHAPVHRRETMTVAVAAGLGFGVMIGGLAGGPLISHWGWPSVFKIGGVVPLLLLPALWWALPGATSDTGNSGSHQNKLDAAAVRSLFRGGLALRTTLLWTFSFLIFTSTYALTFWAPTLLLNFGFGPADVPLGSASIGAGGLVASVLLVPLSAWFGTRRVLAVTSFVATALFVVVARVDLETRLVLPMLGAIGCALISGTLGQSALAVWLYPAASRTAGVGWAAALGRIGSIIGPALGGALLSAGIAPRDVLLTAGVPTLLAATVALIFSMLPNTDDQPKP